MENSNNYATDVMAIFLLVRSRLIMEMKQDCLSKDLQTFNVFDMHNIVLSQFADPGFENDNDRYVNILQPRGA